MTSEDRLSEELLKAEEELVQAIKGAEAISRRLDFIEQEIDIEVKNAMGEGDKMMWKIIYENAPSLAPRIGNFTCTGS